MKCDHALFLSITFIDVHRASQRQVTLALPWEYIVQDRWVDFVLTVQIQTA